MILAAAVAGLAISGRMGSPVERDSSTAPPLRAGLIALVACGAACLLNPSFHRIYPAALGTVLPIPGWEEVLAHARSAVDLRPPALE